MKMRIQAVLLLILSLAALAGPAAAQQDGPVITSPAVGDALQGVVSVLGISNITDFASAELAFTYANNPTDTWFLVATSDRAVDNDILGTWDTTGITDGTYRLRLRVYLADGTYQDALVEGLRVRNYTPIETVTSVELPTEILPVATVTQTATSYPTPTLLPTNPVAVTTGAVNNSLIFGALAAVVIFSFVGVIARLRIRNI